MSSYPDPYVVRSQRNKKRRPVSSRARQGSLQHGNRAMALEAHSRLRMVKSRHHLGYLSTIAIILNRMVGTGIFVAPAVVLSITGSKGLSLILWAAGGIITWTGMRVYLEYGIRWPLTGGELHYIDFVWLRPHLLATYMYSYMYILLSGSQSNALVFGAAVIQASTPKGTVPDHRLQKFFSILLVATICQFQAISRMNYVRFSNLFAIYKICFLSALTVIGWFALAGKRLPAAATKNEPYGTINLHDSFGHMNNRPYAIALAMLLIMRVYSGYENANFVLEEVRRPPNDETRVFRRSSMAVIAMVSFFYVMFNLALFAACSTEELLASSDVLSLFFAKVFGKSPQVRIAAGVLLSISSAGNVMSTTFASVRVKQEIARLGIVPWPEFWAKSTRLNTPGPALLLHWISSTVLIIATPLSSANGYLVFSTVYNYARTIAGAALGGAMLFARRIESFSMDGNRWGVMYKPWTRAFIKLHAAIYVLANLFVFIVQWFPASLQNTLNTKSRVVPSFVGPVVAITCYTCGALLWCLDRHIAPRFGYHEREVLQEQLDGLNVHMNFTRNVDGVAAVIIERYRRLKGYFKRPRERKVGLSDEEGQGGSKN